MGSVDSCSIRCEMLGLPPACMFASYFRASNCFCSVVLCPIRPQLSRGAESDMAKIIGGCIGMCRGI